ncbi:MAG TPA: GGDEF domain-containing protein [Noviherbaspirillum sp.]
MDELLPIIGPAFGIAVLLFAAWDYFVDPANGTFSAIVRMVFVAAAAIAYRKTFLPWTPSQRSEYIYCMYASSIILSQYLLEGGLHYGAVGATSGMFILAIIAGSVAAFVWSAIPPMLLYTATTATTFQRFEFINGMVFYMLAFAIAFTCMMMVRYLRRKAFFLEYELTQRATHDALTGLFNRGHLNDLGMREIAMVQRHPRPLAIAMLDIDHFKAINDTYGHDIGDLALKALATTCRNSVRQTDHIGRFGGEEFICIMPETLEEDALACAERLRENVEAMRIDTPRGVVRFTVSIGVALYGAEHTDWEGLVKDADTAMYRAKQDGRNCIRLARREAIPPAVPASVAAGTT